MDYNGEVIDEDQKTEREDKGQGNYFFQFPGAVKLFIDARKKGNLCRFVNHSCNPNCQVTEVNSTKNII